MRYTRQLFQRFQPFPKVRTLGTNHIEANSLHGDEPVHWLLIISCQLLNALRRCCVGRIVNLLRTCEPVPDLLNLGGKFWTSNSEAEAFTIAEEHSLELVHHHVRYEPIRVEAGSHLLTYVR